MIYPETSSDTCLVFIDAQAVINSKGFYMQHLSAKYIFIFRKTLHPFVHEAGNNDSLSQVVSL